MDVGVNGVEVVVSVGVLNACAKAVAAPTITSETLSLLCTWPFLYQL